MKILHNKSRTVLWENPAITHLREATLYGATLYGATLYGANLYGANLYGADLHEADLREADLRGANLYGANLRGADLHKADLREANLYGAILYGADLRFADLREANLNWSSHELISEILMQASHQDPQKRMIAGLILISKDWCWKEFLQIKTPHSKWAIETLLPFSTKNNPAPFTDPTFSKILAKIMETNQTA